MNHVREPFQSLLNDLRDGTAALERAAALGKLKDGKRMSNDPYDMTVAEERAQQVDEQIDRLLAENDRLLSQISDLETALEKISGIAGDYGDGAPDDHYLAHILLDIEAIAKDALDEARGTHRKALEAMQKRQQP